MTENTGSDLNDFQTASDLDWAVNSPFLAQIADSRVTFPTVDAESVDRRRLSEFLKTRRTGRVGNYFEYLIYFYLVHVAGVEIVAQGMQIKDENRTLGELDFVFQDHAKALHHWETAVKFYLYLPDQTHKGSRYVGPNPVDSFESKMNHLRTHQLPLSRLAFSDISSRLAFVKGRIFYPAEHAGDVIPPEDCGEYVLSKNRLRGTWLHHRRFASYADQFADKDVLFRILSKPFWLSAGHHDAEVHDPSILLPHQAVRKLDTVFQRSRNAVQVSILRWEDENLTETDRLCVVNDQWPNG